VRKILVDWDCRRIRDLQDIAFVELTKARDVILAFNRSQTMARAVDENGSIFTCYALDGMKFDVDDLLHKMEQHMGINFHASIAVRQGKPRRGKLKAA
jgi:hypothetical protein